MALSSTLRGLVSKLVHVPPYIHEPHHGRPAQCSTTRSVVDFLDEGSFFSRVSAKKKLGRFLFSSFGVVFVLLGGVFVLLGRFFWISRVSAIFVVGGGVFFEEGIPHQNGESPHLRSARGAYLRSRPVVRARMCSLGITRRQS